MSATNDGGPAFPYPTAFTPTGAALNPREYGFFEGMSLRDWFAGQAQIPWSVAYDKAKSQRWENGVQKVVYDSDVITCRAKLKYMEADAMLAARAKGKEVES